VTDESNYGREPVTVVELYQKRCSLTFGSAPCTATGTPKCYQTWLTCRDRTNIDTDGSITWRFTKPRARIMPIYEESGGHIKTNPIPILESVSTTSSSINLGSQREGQSPLGTKSGVTVSLSETLWDDHVGDPYLADRVALQTRFFWALWRARNAFYTDMMIHVYEGYEGQALADMQRRDYILDGVTGPGGGRGVTLTGKDPLRLTALKDAQFPRATDIRLQVAIDASTTAIRVACTEADLSDDFGNTGSTRYITMGREIISYTGWSLVSTGIYDLTGVSRPALDTTAAAQSENAALQRCGRYEGLRQWEISADLIDNHTRIPSGYRDAAAWGDEGNEYLVTGFTDLTVPTPRGVEKLLGDMCQHGNFSIWWDERERTIPLLANRPPQIPPREITDDLNIIGGTAELTDDVEAQITRVAIYYAPRNPFDLDKPENYRTLRLSIDGFVEAPAAANAVRTLTIYAYSVTRDASAFRLATRLLLRYRLIQKYLNLELDAKDRSIKLGDVLAVTTAAFVETEGGMLSTRWQVIKAEEHRPGDAFRVELQSFFLIGRFGFIMPSTATDDYASATDEEKATGFYIADETTQAMPGGDDPYLIQ
jgi:hypothetical protein